MKELKKKNMEKIGKKVERDAEPNSHLYYYKKYKIAKEALKILV